MGRAPGEHAEHFRLDVDRVNQSLGADHPRQFQRVEAVAGPHVADGLPGLDAEGIEHHPAILFALPALPDQPRRTGVVHRLGDLAPHVEGQGGGDAELAVELRVDRQRADPRRGRLDASYRLRPVFPFLQRIPGRILESVVHWLPGVGRVERVLLERIGVGGGFLHGGRGDLPGGPHPWPQAKEQGDDPEAEQGQRAGIATNRVRACHGRSIRSGRQPMEAVRPPGRFGSCRRTPRSGNWRS